MAIKVTIVDYNPIWPELFELEKGKLLATVGDYVLDIQHIGSTAVPGLAAKPVIDIMIGVRTLAEADAACIEPIVQLGYEYVQAFETMISFRRYFRQDSPDGVRTHQIHLVERESEWWQRHLAFRDYLRSHEETRATYEQFKRNLATQIDVVGKNDPSELMLLVPASLTPSDFNLEIRSAMGNGTVRTGILADVLGVS